MRARGRDEPLRPDPAGDHATARRSIERGAAAPRPERRGPEEERSLRVSALDEAKDGVLEPGSRAAPRSVHVIECETQILAARFSPCGRWLAAGGHDGLVRLWSCAGAAPRPLEPLAGHHGWVQALAFCPASGLLISGDSWGELRAWSLAGREPAEVWRTPQAHDGWIRAAAVRRAGDLAATCGRDGRIRLWSPADGSPRGELVDPGGDVLAIAFHPAGTELAAGSPDGRVRHWDLGEGRIRRELDAGILFKLDGIQDVGGSRVLAFDRAGELLASAGTRPKGGGFVEGTPLVRLFRWRSGETIRDIAFGEDKDGFVTDLAFLGGGSLALVTSGQPGQGQLIVQDPAAPEPAFRGTEMANCHALALHAGRGLIAVAATNAESNGNGRVLDAAGRYAANRSPIHIFEIAPERDRASL